MMMTETTRWISTTTNKHESVTSIGVAIGGEAAEKLRQHYGQEGEVRVTHTLISGGGAATWSATLWIGDEVVHREPEEVTTASHTLNEGEKWKTRLTGGHRMIRHLIEVTG